MNTSICQSIKRLHCCSFNFLMCNIQDFAGAPQQVQKPPTEMRYEVSNCEKFFPPKAYIFTESLSSLQARMWHSNPIPARTHRILLFISYREIFQNTGFVSTSMIDVWIFYKKEMTWQKHCCKVLCLTAGYHRYTLHSGLPEWQYAFLWRTVGLLWSHNSCQKNRPWYLFSCQLKLNWEYFSINDSSGGPPMVALHRSMSSEETMLSSECWVIYYRAAGGWYGDAVVAIFIVRSLCFSLNPYFCLSLTLAITPKCKRSLCPLFLFLRFHKCWDTV